jgi:WhiB family redox-sensing transcriptional regulator
VGVLTEAVAREQFVVYLMDDVDGPVGLEELVDRPEWMASGACRGADAGRFFPGRGQDVRPAKALCARCPVRADCLEYALADTGLQGIWGGTSARERRQIRFRFTRRSA